MKTNQLYFRFKGSRDYIHGSDVFDVLEQSLKLEGKHIQELTFRDFSANHLACVLIEPIADVKAEGKAVDSEGNKTLFWLIETDEPVTERYPFEENKITCHARIIGKTIEASNTEQFSVIEQIVALTKALNYSITPGVNGKWVFGQLRLQEALPGVVENFIIRQKALLDSRFSIHEIKLDNCVVGDIRFITSKS